LFYQRGEKREEESVKGIRENDTHLWSHRHFHSILQKPPSRDDNRNELPPLFGKEGNSRGNILQHTVFNNASKHIQGFEMKAMSKDEERKRKPCIRTAVVFRNHMQFQVASQLSVFQFPTEEAVQLKLLSQGLPLGHPKA
jgi:hypothetical protein